MRRVRFAALGAVWRTMRASSHPGTPGLGARVRAIPRLVLATMRGRYAGVTRTRLLAMAVALAYIVSPVDLLPELILPLVGLIDDAFVAAWLAGAVLLETERFLQWEDSQHDVVAGHVLR
jgi:uncharacterized membrane protein YkvA (DUF1232 family)